MIIMRIHHGSRGDPGGKSDFVPTPQVIRDGLDDMISPLDGKPQTSKRAYYQSLRKAGCEVNPEATIRDQNRPEADTSGLKAEIARALRDLKGQ
jgi:hypothetical protein